MRWVKGDYWGSAVMPRPELKTLNPLCVPYQSYKMDGITRAPQWLDDLISAACSMDNYGNLGLRHSVVLKCLGNLPLISTSTVFTLLYTGKTYRKYENESDIRQARRYSAVCRHVINGIRGQWIQPRFTAWRDQALVSVDDFNDD